MENNKDSFLTGEMLMDDIYATFRSKFGQKIINLSGSEKANWMVSRHDGAHQNYHYYYRYPEATLCIVDEKEWLMIRGFPNGGNEIQFSKKRKKLNGLKDEELLGLTEGIIRGKENTSEEVSLQKHSNNFTTSATDPRRDDTLFWLLKHPNTRFIIDVSGNWEAKQSEAVALDAFKPALDTYKKENPEELVEPDFPTDSHGFLISAEQWWQDHYKEWKENHYMTPASSFVFHALETALSRGGLHPEKFKKQRPFKISVAEGA